MNRLLSMEDQCSTSQLMYPSSSDFFSFRYSLPGALYHQVYQFFGIGFQFCLIYGVVNMHFSIPPSINRSGYPGFSFSINAAAGGVKKRRQEKELFLAGVMWYNGNVYGQTTWIQAKGKVTEDDI